VAASGPEEAIAIVRARGASFRLLLTDIVMPGMSGKRMVDMLAEEGSTLPVLYMSGYARDTIVHHGVLDPGVSLLAKPFTPEQLVERVNRAIGEASARRSGERAQG
jgi:CheY-like chemotaxis protein